MKKKTLFLSGAAVAAAATGWAYYRYRQQMKGTFARLRAESEVLRTTLRFTPISLRRAGMVHDADWSSKFERQPIERITAPTLVIHGTTDQIMPIAHGEWVAQTVPGARMVSIEGGHICLFTHSKVTLPALAGFLGEYAPGR